MDDYMGVYTVKEESTGVIMTYCRLFPLQISFGKSTLIFYYEFAINILGIELSITIGDW